MSNAKKYTVALKVLGEVYTKSAKTLEDAFDLGLGWQEIKGKGSLEVTYGDSKHEQLMTAPDMRRICNNPTTRHTWAKRITSLLN